MITVTIKTELNPTEEAEKILKVIRNFSPFKKENLVIEPISEDYYIYTVTVTGLRSLDSMYEELRKQRTIESARKLLLRKAQNRKVSFMLNKQALFMKKFHFCQSPSESPMGPVWITIESSNLPKLLDYLVPHTIKGKPQEVTYIPK